MPLPELSVMMIAFNAEAYIAEAISGILGQSYPHFELIIINDGSTDHTADIINSFSDPRLAYYAHTEKKGIGFSRNHALELAQADYFTFHDADDVSKPEKFAKQLHFLKANPDFGMVGSSVIRIDKAGKELGRWRLNARPEQIPAIMLFHNYFVNSSVIFRRSAIEGFHYTQGFHMAEDYMMWCHILLKSKALNLDDYLTRYRQHPDSITVREGDKRKACDQAVFSFYFNQIGIQPTAIELELQYFIKSTEPVSNLGQLKACLGWMRKLLQTSLASTVIDSKSIRPMLRNRWLKLCYKARRNPILFVYGILQTTAHFKLFFNWTGRIK